jgi:Cellulase (glycosyl hydrolase family 5)
VPGSRRQGVRLAVRLQLDQDDLVGPDGTGFNQAYMAAIRSEVALAERYRLVVVLNDETNYSPVADAERGPTPGTEAFWKDLAAVYGNDPQVIFDLFNEPRMHAAGMSQAQEWHLWLDGGAFGGVRYSIGMAQLAAYVRTTLGARNLFWVEGPNLSASFAGMVQQHAVLNVSGVVYAVHHPAGPADTASWDADFGYLVTTGVAPVVDGEWTNYEPPPTARRVGGPGLVPAAERLTRAGASPESQDATPGMIKALLSRRNHAIAAPSPDSGTGALFPAAMGTGGTFRWPHGGVRDDARTGPRRPTVQLAVQVAVQLAVQVAVQLAVQVAVQLAVQVAVQLAV